MANPNVLQRNRAGEAAAAATMSLFLIGVSFIGCRNIPEQATPTPVPEPVPTAAKLSALPVISTALLAIKNSQNTQAFLDTLATEQSANSTALASELGTQQASFSTRYAENVATEEARRQSLSETALPAIQTALTDNNMELSHSKGPHRGTLYVTQTALAKAEGTFEAVITPSPPR